MRNEKRKARTTPIVLVMAFISLLVMSTGFVGVASALSYTPLVVDDSTYQQPALLYNPSYEYFGKLTFDATLPTYINAPFVLVNDTATNYTVTGTFIWFGTEVTTERFCIMESDPTYGISIEVMYSAPNWKLRCYFGAATGSFIGTTTIVPDQQYDFEINVDVGTTDCSLYLDGNQENTIALVGGDIPNMTGLKIGTYRSADGRWFDGVISNVKVYESAFLKAHYMIAELSDPVLDAEPFDYYLEDIYSTTTYQHKVQPHTHTTESDGIYTPTEVMNFYKSEGFVAVAITDHDLVTADPAVDGVVHIIGDEYSNADGHIIGLNVTSHKVGTTQEQIDDAISQGGLAFLVHPEYGPATIGWTYDELDVMTSYTGIEIFSGYSDVNIGNAEMKSDYILKQGGEINFIASDDFHNLSDFYNGWIELNTDIPANTLTTDDIITILQSGDYLSMGRIWNTSSHPASLDISVDRKTITATSNITTTIEFITSEGVSQSNASCTSASFTLTSWDQMYVRVKATTSSDDDASWTFSNPIFLRGYELTGDSHVWNGTTSSSAATAANWNKVGEWTTHEVPSTDDNIIFNATGAANDCILNISVAFGQVYIQASYNGNITQTTAFSCTAFTKDGASSSFMQGANVIVYGPTEHVDGWFNGSTSYNWTQSGATASFSTVDGVSTDPHSFNIIMNAQDATISGTAELTPNSLTLSTDVYVSGIVGFKNLTIASGETVTINSSSTLYWRFADGNITNLGTIAGPGSFRITLYTTNATWTPGVVNAPTYIYSTSAATSDRFVTLTENLEQPIAMYLYSTSTTGATTTLDTGSYAILTNSFTLNTGGLLIGRGLSLNVSDIAISVSTSSTSLTIIPDLSTSIMAWSDDTDTVTTYTITGLDSEMTYRVYQDENVVAFGDGVSFSFSATGGGEFEVVVWNTKSVSSIIVLTVNMVGLGIVVTILASFVVPIADDIKKKRPLKVNKITQTMIRTVIFLVVGLLMWGMLHEVVIG